MNFVSTHLVRYLRVTLPAVAMLTILGTVWHIGVKQTGVASYLFPSPAKVFAAGWETRGPLSEDFVTTMVEALVGLGLGTVVGITVAIVLSQNKYLRYMIEPALVISQSVPAVILAPLFIVWFGYGTWPKVLVVSLVAFFPVVVATLSGFDSVNVELRQLFESYGASRTQRLIHLQLPSAAEEIFAGTKIAATYAIFGAIVGEWMGATAGLGIYLQESQSSFKTDQIFAAVLVIALASISLYGGVSLLASLATPWKWQRSIEIQREKI